MISKKEVKHIAKLARLGLTQKEMEKMQKDLSSILDYFKVLKEVNTKEVELTSQATFAKTYFAPQVMRKDEVKKESPETVNRLIEMAPKKKKGYIRVKSIL